MRTEFDFGVIAKEIVEKYCIEKNELNEFIIAVRIAVERKRVNSAIPGLFNHVIGFSNINFVFDHGIDLLKLAEAAKSEVINHEEYLKSLDLEDIEDFGHLIDVIREFQGQ